MRTFLAAVRLEKRLTACVLCGTTMRAFSFIVLGLTCGCAGPFETRKTKWSIDQVRDWYADYRKSDPHAWDGIIYQGSDARRHHFVAKMLSVDNWTIIQIRREELTLADERPVLTVSTRRLGY